MNYKKFFSSTALVTLLSLSHSAFSDSVGPIEDEETSYYVRLQYNGEFGNKIGELKGKSGNSAVFNAQGYDDVGNKGVNYNPKYQTSYTAGSAAVGYTMEGIRVELEGLYSQLDVDTKGYQENGAAKPANAKKFWINTGRFNVTKAGQELIDDARNKLNTAKENLKNNSTSDKTKEEKKVAESQLSLDQAIENNTSNIYYNMENEGFRNIAAMVNAYYDIDLGNDLPVVPYVGAGIGITQIKFLGKAEYKPAYQAKAGISYAVTPDVKLYAGARYFGVYGDEFDGVRTIEEIRSSQALNDANNDTTKRVAAANALEKTVTGTATITNSFTGVYGIEAGVMFNF